MIISAEFLRLVKELKQAIGAGQTNEVGTIDNRLWQLVQATTVGTQDKQAILETLGVVALTLRQGGEFQRACRWYGQLCDFCGTFAPWSKDTAWDYCHYAECLVNVGDKMQATVWLENAKGVAAMVDAPNPKLQDKIRHLTTACS